MYHSKTEYVVRYKIRKACLGKDQKRSNISWRLGRQFGSGQNRAAERITANDWPMATVGVSGWTASTDDQLRRLRLSQLSNLRN
jgi:hypothetical protein